MTAPPNAARPSPTHLLNCAPAIVGLIVLLAAWFALPSGRARADDVPLASDVSAVQGVSDKAADGATADGSTATQPARMADDPRLYRLGHTVLWSLVLLLVFISAAIAIIVFSRRYRQYLSQSTQHEKTEYVDVWKLHKVPQNLDIEPDEEDDDAEKS